MIALHYSKEKMKLWRNFSDAVLKTDIKRKAVSTYLKLNATLRRVFFLIFLLTLQSPKEKKSSPKKSKMEEKEEEEIEEAELHYED